MLSLIFLSFLTTATFANLLQPQPEIAQATELLIEAATELITSEDPSGQSYTVFISWETAEDHLAGHLTKLVDRVLNTLSSKDVVIEVINRTPVTTRRPRSYNVFFIDGLRAFDEIYKTICPKLFNFAGFYVVVVLGGDVASEPLIVTRILELMWSYKVVNIDVLFAGAREVHEYTYFPFSPKFCEQVHPIVWNVFREGHFVSPRGHFPPKLGNFHRCPLSVALYTYGAFMQLQHGSRGEITSLDGVDARMLKYLARTLNFSYVPREVPNGLRFGLIYENGTTTGAMQMVVSGQTNFTLGFFGYNLLRHRFMSLTQNYHYSELIMVISPGEEYEAFEKLLLPFNNRLWFVFFVWLVGAFLAIFIISNTRRPIQNFVFGYRINTPSLNLLNLLFGGSLAKLPGRNFARFLLTMWIIYSLVLRTVYQQTLFNFLHQSPNHSTVNTLAQIIAGRYPIYVIPSEVYVFDNMPELQPLLRIIPLKDIQRYEDAIRRGQLRGARVSNYEKTMFDNSKINDGRFFRIVKQRLYNYAVCVGLQLNSCLTKPFDDAILELNANGLVQAWVFKYIDKKYGAVREEIDEPRKLTVRQLLGAFQVWSIGLGGAVLVFLGEVFRAFVEKRITNP